MPLCLRDGDVAFVLPLLVELVGSGCESLAGLRLRSRMWGDKEGFARTASLLVGRGEEVLSLKMCTVSVAEETQRREEVALKDML